MESALDEASNTAKLTLPESITGENAEALIEELLALQNNNLDIDAGNVVRLDTPCIEVFLAAKKLWERDRCQVQFSQPSSSFNETISVLGLEQTDLETGAS